MAISLTACRYSTGDDRADVDAWDRHPALEQSSTACDLGFYQESRNGQEVVSHAGDLVGFHSDLHLMPKDHIGIFMSFNGLGKAGGVETVRTQLFRQFL